ncbi:NUMOD4 motif-containing HNH endonuclease [Gordonia malaquae]|uniref:NUMOD4 motif-containing HNH endonuclease n=1 Tax=Gordonia malaquae TaxID=410332 RepID=UPI0030FE75D1
MHSDLVKSDVAAGATNTVRPLTHSLDYSKEGLAVNATQFDLEQWRPVLGFEGLYQVSDRGRVRSLDRTIVQSNGTTRTFKGQVLRQVRMNAYMTVGLSHAGRGFRRTVHRLVLESFVGPRPDGMEACHNDSDGTNNHLQNLRWDTRKENAADRVRAGRAVGWNSKKTQCKRGHEFTPENTYEPPGGRERQCRTCRKQSKA